jgi:hypothetical protein
MANCDQCGANLDLVGRSHLCRVSITSPPSASKLTFSGTYQYRDPEKRREYMRDYMRKRRGQKETA